MDSDGGREDLRFGERSPDVICRPGLSDPSVEPLVALPTEVLDLVV